MIDDYNLLAYNPFINGMSNPTIGEEGRKYQFSKTNQPDGRGRKPRLLKQFIKGNNIGIADQVAIFENVIANFSANEIKRMVQTGIDTKGKPLSGLVWGFLMAWLADNKRGWGAGGINVFFRERRFGKTPEKVISLTEDLTKLTPEERDAEIERLYQEHRDSMRRRGDATAGQTDGASGRAQEADEEEPGTPEGEDR